MNKPDDGSNSRCHPERSEGSVLRHMQRFFAALRMTMAGLLLFFVMCLGSGGFAADDPRPHSHPPMRRLPAASRRPVGDGPTYFVDVYAGSDENNGALAHPWRTIGYALQRIEPGDTLCLRRGVYHEHVTVSLAGTAEKPITLRSYPGEIAILDGGVPEMLDSPATAWQPFSGRASGEYQSTKSYPEFGNRGQYRHEVALVGNFAGSMVPLHGYRFVSDFRTVNEYWNVPHKLDPDSGVYCGPGVWLDPETHRIHVRLAHTRLNVLGQNNYRGETDPRKLPLVVAGYGTVLDLRGAKHIRVQDLVVRGSAGNTVEVVQSAHVGFDGVTIYGGAPAMMVRSSNGLRLIRSTLRGLSAPWSSRASHKYRGISPYLFIASGDTPQCRDFEIAYCEFTDNHDGVVVGTIDGLHFHHNSVDNFDDDGIYLTLSRPAPPKNLRIDQNDLSRCHTMFSFAEGDGGSKADVGPGAFICRNVLDFRRGTYSNPPRDAAADACTVFADHCRAGRPASDHGSPIWEPMYVYHNTVISAGKAFRNYYGAGWGGHTRDTRRRVFNNIFVQIEDLPGLNFASAEHDVQADGNLLWGVRDGRGQQDAFFDAFRASRLFADSKRQYPPGWGAGDLFADPKFVRFSENPRKTLDLRLQPGSPAVDGGVALPHEWPDPLRYTDRGRPDMGAFPLGAEPFQVGPHAK